MKKDILVIGASGFSKEILFSFDNQIDRFVFFDDVNEKIDSFFDDFLVFKKLDEVSKCNLYYFVLGFGGSKMRKVVFKKFYSANLTPITLIARTSKIGQMNTHIGNGTLVMDNVLISNNIKIGEGCLINKGVIVSHDSIIGDFCDISPGANIMGWTKIGSHVEIGANATILPKILIGDNVIVGAGSVVTNNVPDNAIVVGNPARFLRNNK